MKPIDTATVKPSVAAFAKLIEAAIVRNDRSTGVLKWDDADALHLLNSLIVETGEAARLISRGCLHDKLVVKLADIAAVACGIAVYAGLEIAATEDTK